MKKTFIINFLFFTSILGFSYSLNFGEVVDYSDPTDLYEKVETYYNMNLNEAESKGYNEIAKKYGTNVSTIVSILEGDLSKCTEIFGIMGINKRNYNEDDFLICQGTIKNQLDNYKKSKNFNKTVDDSTAGENVLSDGIEDNGPFDLLVDINTMSKILFKDEIVFDNVSYQVAISNENDEGDSNSLLGGSSLGNNNTLTNEQNETENENNNPTNNENNENNDLNNNDNPINSNNNLDSNGNYTNNNLQIGNICSSNINKNNINNGSVGNNNGNSSGRNNNGIGNNDDGFQTFNGGGDLGGFIEGDNKNEYGSIFSDDGEGGIDTEIGALIDDQGICPPEDYILAICVKLIPSGPRGPVGGTVYKRGIDSIIEKINDTLREMKDENFITQAGHGDEALDIDYKNIDLSEHFSFDMVLSSKPVFDYKQDKRAKAELNKADTNWNGVPRKLAKMYAVYGIGDPFDKENDKTKYLISNEDYSDEDKVLLNNYEEKINDTSEKGVYSIMQRHEDFVVALYDSTKGLIKVSKKIKKTAELLNAKAE